MVDAMNPERDQLKAELDKAFEHLGQATKAVGFLTDTLAAVRDIAYRAGAGTAARDALEAIHQRASRAIGSGS